MSVALPKRLSRPENPPVFRITERDIAIIRAVARWRFLTSEQLFRFLTLTDPATSHQHMLRRLSLLFAHGHLDRPAHQILHLNPFSHLVYGLGRVGARMLAELGDPIAASAQWTLKNTRASAIFLHHTLEVAETMLAFEKACTTFADVHIIDHHALIPYLPETTQALSDPFRLRVAHTQGNRSLSLNVVPDRVFSVTLPGDRRMNFCLETDRGTMAVAPRQLTGKSNFARKIAGYFAAWKEQRHRTQWNFEGFRLLTVAPSETRIKSMLKAQREITKDRLPAMFLYTTPQRLADEGAFGDSWVSSTGDRVRLIG